MIIKMHTISSEGKAGMLGTLYINEMPFCLTVERLWKDNKPNVSCIPPGMYKIKPFNSPKFGFCYCIESSHGDAVKLYGPSERTHILIHPANHAYELQGCIGVGESINCINGDVGVTNSKNTMQKLIDKLGHEEHDLMIYRW